MVLAFGVLSVSLIEFKWSGAEVLCKPYGLALISLILHDCSSVAHKELAVSKIQGPDKDISSLPFVRRPQKKEPQFIETAM